MGFTTTGLESKDHDVIVSLGNAIPRAMRSAAVHIRDNTDLSKRWFGDNDICWIFELQRKLNRFATIIEIHTINIIWITNAGHYENYVAMSLPPPYGWRDNTRDDNYWDLNQQPETTTFKIALGSGWHERPMFRNPANSCSQFQTIVHELSHLLVGTDDITSGYNRCQKYANNNSNFAKKNADSWGFFIESFR